MLGLDEYKINTEIQTKPRKFISSPQISFFIRALTFFLFFYL